MEPDFHQQVIKLKLILMLSGDQVVMKPSEMEGV